MKKVYCFDCEYYHTADIGGNCTYVIRMADNPFRQVQVHAEPCVHNAENRCPYYEESKPVMRGFTQIINLFRGNSDDY